MKNSKWFPSILLAAALCLVLAACMNNGGDVQPQQTVQTDFMPEITDTDLNGDGLSAGGAAQATQAPVAFDWLTGSGQVEANVNRISEIADSRVVVAGNTALVGVRFTPAYRGEMTERIHEMVAAEVLEADPSIQTVAVTSMGEDVDKVFELSDRLRAGEAADQLSEEINRIVRNATTLR